MIYEKRNLGRLVQILVGAAGYMSQPVITCLTVRRFVASASQGDCLWRSSLKVPRATRPLSDCCSRIREPLVWSEDRQLGLTHTL